ncbi:MAG: glutaredoxin family protein [Methanomicrobiales archaeon]|jgi:glutaredoxin|nr:glutaredoxin family protein [Methanomicrobiales archaeon]
MELTHVEGDDRIPVTVFSLSTCGHCRATKSFLEERGIAYDFVDVDLLEGDAFTVAYDEVKAYNPQGSFPTIVIGEEETVVVGGRLDEIAAALGLSL